MRNKAPQQPIAYTPGPPIEPAAALRGWLTAADAPKGMLRLPVVITRDALRLTSAHIGADPKPPTADAVRLQLSDVTMGISLATRLRGLVGPGPGTHVVWLEGRLGDPTGLHSASPAPDTPDDRIRFEVRRVGPTVEAGQVELAVGVE